VKVEIEPDKCIASGQCVLIAESVFDQNDDDGIVRLHNATSTDAMSEQVAADDVEAVLSAARICPARAIHVHDAV
jgi:ferredoxin